MRSLYPWPIFPPDLNQQAARSLSLQMALQEWLYSFNIIDSVRNIAKELKLDTLSNEVQKFLLFSLDNPFTKRAGTLDKLCFYCDELGSHSKTDCRELIESTLNGMRDAVLSFRQKLLSWKRKFPESTTMVSETNSLCKSLEEKLKCFYEALTSYFEEAKSDENVLFYLIEHRTQLNEVLYPKKVEDLLCYLYPSGPAHLRAILCEGYTRRGFGEFYAKHEALIDSIEWTADKWITTDALH
jgi:hypothetical protein